MVGDSGGDRDGIMIKIMRDSGVDRDGIMIKIMRLTPTLTGPVTIRIGGGGMACYTKDNPNPNPERNSNLYPDPNPERNPNLYPDPNPCRDPNINL
jgi:hypothetical protein